MNSNNKIIIYTDGACSNNPGPGGWSAILIYGNKKKIISGYNKLTTNNQMELQAVISALKLLNGGPHNIELWTDSNYVKNGITQWIFNWKKNNWQTVNKDPVKNKELWLELDNLCHKHNITWNWVKGHSTNELNNEVDKLARNEILKNNK